jgi:hypothetical protein
MPDPPSTAKDYDTSKLRDFAIFLNTRTNMTTLMTTLAHESVHLSQIRSGRLRITGDTKGCGIEWMGKPRSVKESYTDVPWEVEAFAKQDRLASVLTADEGFVNLVVRALL